MNNIRVIKKRERGTGTRLFQTTEPASAPGKVADVVRDWVAEWGQAKEEQKHRDIQDLRRFSKRPCETC